MIELLLATHNKHKVEEISQFFSSLPVSIRSLDDFPNIPPTIEDAPDLKGNALKKARDVHAATGLLSLADDTGLEVFYLALEPGVFSARYAGENATYKDNCDKLLRAMNGVPIRRRNAQFKTVVAIVGKNFERTVKGVVTGRILETPQGSGGFGYDPLFVPQGMSRSYAEMTIEEKNKISHRALALEKAADVLHSFHG